jgi:PIN domain nuclease of toxin-antitoxin system
MPEAPAGALVLDTHVWIWTVEGDRAQLSSAALRQIERARRAGRDSDLRDIRVRGGHARDQGRISLSRPVDERVRAALRASGSSLLALTPEIAIDSTRLPGSPPEDHADRVLIASARG